MKRKLMAFSLAMAMTVSSGSMAFGATPIIKGNAGTSLADGVSSETVTGDATISYVDKDITIVDLPTSKPDFVLDPQGLYGAVNDANYKADDTTGTKDVNALAGNHVGEISGKNYLVVTNRGANKVKVETTFLATSTATDEDTKPQFVAKEADVDTSNTKNTISLKVSLNSNFIQNAVGTPAAGGDAGVEKTFVKKASSPAVASEQVFAPATKGVAEFDNIGKTMTFVLGGDDTYAYTVSGAAGSETFGYANAQVAGDTAAKGQTSPVSQALYISGKMNDKADWSKYAGADPANKVGVKVIYSVSKAADTDTANEDTSGWIKTENIAGGGVVATGDATSAVIDFTPSAISNATLAEYIKINDVVLSNDANWSRGVLGSLSGNRITLTTRGLTAAGITGTGNYAVQVKDSEGNTYDCTLNVA